MWGDMCIGPSTWYCCNCMLQTTQHKTRRVLWNVNFARFLHVFSTHTHTQFKSADKLILDMCTCSHRHPLLPNMKIRTCWALCIQEMSSTKIINLRSLSWQGHQVAFAPVQNFPLESLEKQKALVDWSSYWGPLCWGKERRLAVARLIQSSLSAH